MLEDLQKALSLGPTHLSWYQLTIEPNTEFYARPPPLPEDDLLIEMQDSGIELIKEAGFQRYEVSAYSKLGYQSQHNLNYWLFGDYLGIGAGAHGKISDPDTGSSNGLAKKDSLPIISPVSYRDSRKLIRFYQKRERLNFY